MDAIELMDKAKEVGKIPSDYALAKELGYKPSDISHWRSGKHHPSVYAATRLAIIAKLDPMTVVADIERHNEKNDQRRQWWNTFFTSASKAASVILGAVLLVTLWSVQVTSETAAGGFRKRNLT